MNSQLRVVAGDALLQVEVRGQMFDCSIRKTHQGWVVAVRGTYTNEELQDPHHFRTWANAYRAALRHADGMAPFRSHEAKR